MKPCWRVAGINSVIDEDLLSPGDFLQSLEPETSEAEHGVIEPSKAAVGSEAVVGLVRQRRAVVADVPEPGGDVQGVGVGGPGPVQEDHVV